jgi:NAD(P)-dependent dehydrogenase (short-subunit alcohol dehydrogenase family)
MDAKPLQNAVIAVTGAGRGYGHAIGRAVGAAGASVIVVDADAEAAAAVASELEALGAQAIPIKGNFSVQLEVASTFEKMLEIFGALTGVVHLADGVSHTKFRRLHEAEWSDLLDHHARSSYLLLQSLGLKAKGAWATLVLPPADGLEPQVRALRGLLCGLVEGLSESGVRANGLIPSRPSGGLEADALLAQAALALALPHTRGLSGASLHVALPALPDPLAGLPPEAFE